MERFYLAALLAARKLKEATVRVLVEKLGTAEAVWRAPIKELALYMRDAERTALVSHRDKNEGLAERIAEQCEKKHIAVYMEADEKYPPLLKEIFQPPMVLFCRGELQPFAHRIAMVGARKFTLYGKHVAEELGAEIASRGITVVSGGARGIDTSSHTGALKTGRTVAVLGCGIDVVYPPENRALFDEIAEKGAVISEYSPGTAPLAPFFPARNRIISGLSMGTLVVEAAERSGSLITAELALSQGRDVFAVPGSIYSPTSEGCNRLIQQGAKLVRSVDDVLSEYNMAAPKKRSTKKRSSEEEMPAGLSAEEQKIYELLSLAQAMTVDEIIYALHGSGDAANVAFLLLQMELRGYVEEDENHAYCRAVKEAH